VLAYVCLFASVEQPFACIERIMLTSQGQGF
jgi:hypothetical protein